jgi:hypothetical protein
MQHTSTKTSLVQGVALIPRNHPVLLEESIAFEALNPGISIETLVVFDLAPGFDLAGSTLELHDSGFSGGVAVAV